MDTVALWIIAMALAAFFVAFVVAFAYVWRQIAILLALLGLWREGRRFFKKIERFRRDFQ